MAATVGLRWIAAAAALWLATPSLAAGVGDAGAMMRTTKHAFQDVLTDVEAAIVNRGLVIDLKGNIGAMLDRTGKDLGSSKKLYTSAQYFTFCSARLSRAMMEVDPGNMAFCPFVVFVYERAEEPGIVTVGFRRPPAAAGASSAAFADIDKLLTGIVEEATK